MNNSVLHNKVQKTILEFSLIDSNTDSILVGVSGGIDSVVLCRILHKLGYKIAIAHYNFMLRSSESDEDEQFVKSLAEELHIPYYSQKTDTKEFASEEGISIEMAARELRYSWFENICKKHNYSKIAIAHNANDSVETFFINLFRSSGIKGLCGIPISNNKIIRPLLHCTRLEIESFANENKILYRIDSSNNTNEYTRNKIRNQLLPLCKEIDIHSFEAIQQSMHYLQQSYNVYSEAIQKDIKDICSITNTTLVIDKEGICTHNNAEVLLFEILQPYGFNSDVISQLYTGIEEQVGKKYTSKTHIASLDRDYIFVDEIIDDFDEEYIIDDFESFVEIQTKEHSLVLKKLTNIPISKNSKEAFIDASKITFPLTLRTWKDGDSFVPYGMTGTKKISDFLIDIKAPSNTKNKILVLESQGIIIWLVGYRISNKIALKEQTKQILHIEVSNI